MASYKLISRKKLYQILFYFMLCCFILISAGPLFWQISSSFRLEKEYYQGITVFPHEWTVLNYISALKETKIVLFFFNSLKVTISTTFFAIVVASLGAYGFSRFNFRGKKIMSRIILLVYMFPPILFMVPVFLTIYHIGLLDTHIGLILTYSIFSLPFAMLLLIAFFNTIPKEIDQAARIDGASNFTIYLRIILPLSLPAISTVAIFTSLSSWNEFLYAMVFIQSEILRTISAGSYLILTNDINKDWGMLMALATIVQIPVLIFFILFGKGLVGGLTMGSIKE
jgi:ABC-type glycerol-3-phosphate transport system permease component